MDEIKVVFRNSGSGFKETLLHTSIGASVQIEQAAGSFLLPQKVTRPQVFVAGGVGIAPGAGYGQSVGTADVVVGITPIGGSGSTGYDGRIVYAIGGTRCGDADATDWVGCARTGILPCSTGVGTPDGIWRVELGQPIEQVSTTGRAVTDDGVE